MPDASHIDFNSLTWRAIEAWANEKIDEARTVIEARATDQITTEFERGRLNLAQEILELDPAKSVSRRPRDTGDDKPIY